MGLGSMEIDGFGACRQPNRELLNILPLRQLTKDSPALQMCYKLSAKVLPNNTDSTNLYK